MPPAARGAGILAGLPPPAACVTTYLLPWIWILAWFAYDAGDQADGTGGTGHARDDMWRHVALLPTGLVASLRGSNCHYTQHTTWHNRHSRRRRTTFSPIHTRIHSLDACNCISGATSHMAGTISFSSWSYSRLATALHRTHLPGPAPRHRALTPPVHSQPSHPHLPYNTIFPGTRGRRRTTLASATTANKPASAAGVVQPRLPPAVTGLARWPRCDMRWRRRKTPRGRRPSTPAPGTAVLRGRWPSGTGQGGSATLAGYLRLSSVSWTSSYVRPGMPLVWLTGRV